MIICEMCDQSLHIYCLKPKLTQVPKDSWYCDNCIKCAICKKKTQPVKSLTEGKWVGVQRVCEKCSQLVENTQGEEDENSQCNSCNKRYEGEFVECDKCSEWHCAPCSGFSAAQLENIENESYICKKCFK